VRRWYHVAHIVAGTHCGYVHYALEVRLRLEQRAPARPCRRLQVQGVRGGAGAREQESCLEIACSLRHDAMPLSLHRPALWLSVAFRVRLALAHNLGVHVEGCRGVRICGQVVQALRRRAARGAERRHMAADVGCPLNGVHTVSRFFATYLQQGVRGVPHGGGREGRASMVFALLLFSQTQEQWGQAGHLVCRYVVPWVNTRYQLRSLEGRVARRVAKWRGAAK
jgi:hypothetical protein